MSMTVDYVYGYGFEVVGLDEDKFFNFLKNHTETIKKLYDAEYLLEFLKKEDSSFIEFCDEFSERESIENYGYNSALSVISDIMTEETGIRFSYQKDSGDDKEYILFTECFPWLCNEKEKNITQDELHDIFDKYMIECGLSPRDERGLSLVQDWKVEYFG